jgi:CubicO group peptidase (beta-lactamase class C family)
MSKNDTENENHGPFSERGIDELLKKQVDQNITPSVQYLLFNKESIIHKFQYGHADLLNQFMVSDHTTYNAYSVTKTFTALAVLQLADQKLLEIEDPVRSYLPEFPYSPDITIRQLLTHSAGILNPVPLDWIHLSEEHLSFDRNKFFNGIFIKNKRTKFPPDVKFSYSNLGYVLLGQLIEKVSEVTYEQYITDNILKKLNLSSGDIGFLIEDKEIHSKGYQKRKTLLYFILGLFIDKSKYMAETEGIWRPFKSIYVNGPSYGGLIGTPIAFMRYLQELLKPDSDIITGVNRIKLFTENHTSGNKPTGMCLSWFHGQLHGKQYFAHAGGGGGYYCEIRIYPDLGLGSVIMFNRTGMLDERFLDKVDSYYIDR